MVLDSKEMMNDKPNNTQMWSYTLGALGVVFGDIGTSPLYSLRECFSHHYGLSVTPENVFGILSLIIWSLILIVSLKYIFFVLRADNKGEGGILALLSLAMPKQKASGGSKRWLIYLGLFGAALLYGDGILTPVVTIFSAVEGLNVATPLFEPFIVPITAAIIIAIFCVQNSGTARIGFVFGPVILIYFLMLTALGLPQIFLNPEILLAFNPKFALDFLFLHGTAGYWVLGSVFLAVTGCEALYADMGHFGRRPIRAGWTYIVFPSLVINYLGQGALLLGNSEAVTNPFFFLAPSWALMPVVVVATCASIIASQALISGAFSLTKQAIQLGFSPRLKIVHTSISEIGQIYIPAVNWTLMIGCIWLVFEFKSSSALAGAYGIAVSLTMLITTILVLIVCARRWNWNPAYIVLVGGLMLFVDFVYLGANVAKIPDGGWFPLATAAVIFVAMTTWKRGRRILAIRLRTQSERLEDFVKHAAEGVFKVRGTGVFMSSDPATIPSALSRNIKFNRVIHERVILLSLITKDVPRVARGKRAEIVPYPNNLYRVTVYFGFMESPVIDVVLDELRLNGIDIQMKEITFFLGRETLIAATRSGGMAMWREKLFAFMSQNAYRATQYFQIPPDQVVEIGSQIEL